MGLKKQFVSAILLGSALTAPLFAQDIATPSSSIDTLAIFSFNDFHGGEGVASSGKTAECADFLCGDDIILFHEAVSL